MSVLPQDVVLPQGSTILVTGANGYISSHVINQLLKYGYKARGTVRDVEKSAWLQEHFDKEYGTGNFELVEVKEITKVNLLGPLKG
jgi:nucleoside-diphosphate-sugar epimerase